MANVKITMNREGMLRLAQSPQVGQVALQAATRGKAHAEQIAPRGETGEYARSFEVEQKMVDVRVKGGVERRAGAVLRNTAPHSLPVEGSHAVLRRTVDSIENGS